MKRPGGGNGGELQRGGWGGRRGGDDCCFHPGGSLCSHLGLPNTSRAPLPLLHGEPPPEGVEAKPEAPGTAAVIDLPQRADPRHGWDRFGTAAEGKETGKGAGRLVGGREGKGKLSITVMDRSQISLQIKPYRCEVGIDF